MSDLDIYVEDRRRFLASKAPVLRQAIPRLEQSGMRVRVLEKLDPAPSAAVACIQVDLTHLPANYLWAHQLYPMCINGRAVSISRDLYSEARVQRGDDTAGPVIVKTLLNYRGLPEFRLMTRPKYRTLRRLQRRIGRRDPNRELRQRLCPEYTIHERVDLVPDRVWDNPQLIVERFVPGSTKPPISKYRHEFFLDITMTSRLTFDEAISGPTSVFDVEFVGDPPSKVTDLRHKLDIDFGSIDYFVIAGEVTIIDANKTTSFNPEWVKRYPQMSSHLDAIAARLVDVVATTERVR